MRDASVELVFGDIFEQHVDAIVNPANRDMSHGGGLAFAISSRGGDAVDEESFAQAPVDTGQAIWTSAGDLPLKGIVHAVGPVFDPANETRVAAQLADAHKSALRVADKHRVQSIAFPAVSCGIFRYPVLRAAPVAVAAVCAALPDTRIDRVVFVVNDPAHHMAFMLALGVQTRLIVARRMTLRRRMFGWMR